MGITPAYAGKRKWLLKFIVFIGDHPPRMRGKVPCNKNEVGHLRITPAYAGKRLLYDALQVVRKDHPRVCGEKENVNVQKKSKLGSPPRMRGKVTSVLTNPLHHGITPAYAGKSKRVPPKTACCRDHPRVCGEKKWKK